jgi:hypothetical protein
MLRVRITKLTNTAGRVAVFILLSLTNYPFSLPNLEYSLKRKIRNF